MIRPGLSLQSKPQIPEFDIVPCSNEIIKDQTYAYWLFELFFKETGLFEADLLRCFQDLGGCPCFLVFLAEIPTVHNGSVPTKNAVVQCLERYKRT